MVDREIFKRVVFLVSRETGVEQNDILSHSHRCDPVDARYILVKLLSDWNPEFAEKKKQDERISNMEKKLDNMMELFQKYMENSSKK